MTGWSAADCISFGFTTVGLKTALSRIIVYRQNLNNNVLHLFLTTGESRTRRKEKTARIAPTGEYRTAKKFMLFAKLQARKLVQNSSVTL